MTVEELVAKYGSDESTVLRSVTSNGLTIEQVDASNEHLVQMYVEYLEARKEADAVRDNFKYQDGEESVDKTKVYDNYRKHYQDLFNAWKESKEMYDRSASSEHSRYYQRKRASWLDRPRASLRRPFR